MKIPVIGEGAETLEPSHIVGDNVKWYKCCRRRFCVSLKILPYDPAVPLLDIYPKGLKSKYSHKYLFMNVYVRVLVNASLDNIVQMLPDVQWFHLWVFDFTMEWKQFRFGRNCTWNFQFGSFLGLAIGGTILSIFSLLMLGSSRKPKPPAAMWSWG